MRAEASRIDLGAGTRSPTPAYVMEAPQALMVAHAVTAVEGSPLCDRAGPRAAAIHGKPIDPGQVW